MDGNKDKKLALVRVRGLAHVRKDVEDTLNKLHLYRKNYCSVWSARPEILGMARKVKDYTTYGLIGEDVFKKVVEKRGEPYRRPETDRKGKIKHRDFFVYEGKSYKKFFRLNNPRKGFERKGIKVSFRKGGALGYRDNMEDLLSRMIEI